MKFLKFDTLYPASYVTKKIQDNKKVISSMSFDEFNDWLIQLRLNFSDYFSYNLQLAGWEAKDLFVFGNHYYIWKMGQKYFGFLFPFVFIAHKFFHRFLKWNLIETLIDKAVRVEKPNVLFIREQTHIDSKFWDRYRDKMLVVCRMECNVDKYWNPACFDLIYTNINSYKNFLECNGFITRRNYSGFDERIGLEIPNDLPKIYSTSFIGGLGKGEFKDKSDFLEELLELFDDKIDFSWWGFKETSTFDNDYPLLAAHWKGALGGKEMFEVYRQTKIVLNDYGANAGGQGINQRIYEVLGVGSFLLTRNSIAFSEWGNSICTFDSAEDCYKKVLYYLDHDVEREQIARCGHEFVIAHFNYRDLVQKLGDELLEEYDRKFVGK